MLICTNCGRKVTTPMPKTREYHFRREIDGVELYEDFIENVCPHCGTEECVEEATLCVECGEYYYDADGIGCRGICPECLKGHETVGNALDYGKHITEHIDINGFVASVLSEKKINEILEKWVEENFVDHSKPVVDYCEADTYEFKNFVKYKILGGK